jgi:hypothetical protein
MQIKLLLGAAFLVSATSKSPDFDCQQQHQACDVVFPNIIKHSPTCVKDHQKTSALAPAHASSCEGNMLIAVLAADMCRCWKTDG